MVRICMTIYKSRLMEYIEYLIEASQWWLFFDKTKAQEKAEEVEREGFQAKMHQERQQYTVFKIKK